MDRSVKGYKQFDSLPDLGSVFPLVFRVLTPVLGAPQTQGTISVGLKITFVIALLRQFTSSLSLKSFNTFHF